MLKKLLRNNKSLLENFSYITLLQIFVLLAPLIVYPYLIKTIGKELYGYVISAQVLASYATIVIRFGFDAVSSRHISINRDNIQKLKSTISAILFTRTALWLGCLGIYLLIVYLIPAYRAHWLLFILSYGLTFQILLFPQFFFQGIEKMKFIALINVIIQIIFTVSIFLIVKSASDYYYIPVLHAIGYIIGGCISLFIIINKFHISLTLPSKHDLRYHIKDAFPLFLTDGITTIKDKLNYILLGLCVNMSDVVVYDLGTKLTSLAVQPLQIVNTVIFPRMAKTQNNKSFFRFGLIVFIGVILIVTLINFFLPYIVQYFLGSDIELYPLRIFMMAPIFLGIGSYIASSFIVARGYNKYMLHSIFITTIAYLIILGILYINGYLNNLLSFILLTISAYFIEMVYRIIIMRKLMPKKNYMQT